MLGALATRGWQLFLHRRHGGAARFTAASKYGGSNGIMSNNDMSNNDMSNGALLVVPHDDGGELPLL